MLPNDDALIEACTKGRVSDVENAIRSGASPNTAYRECTAIHWAVQYEQVAVVELLLHLGADPDQPDADEDGLRPLHTAAGTGNTAILAKLLHAGADPNGTARGIGDGTALHNAAAYGHERCVKLLVKHGAKTSQEDQDGNTPADYARENGHTLIADWLESQAEP